MSVEEMRKLIKEKIETLSETQLKELDSFISRINSTPVEEWNLGNHVKNIVEEREEVLKKLAK
jgi:uncharacterized protein (UPF0335 family)